MKKIFLIFSLLTIIISNAFSSSPRKQVELILQDSASGLAGVATVYFADGTSSAYVSSEDIAFLLQSPDNSPQLYSFSQDNIACSSNSYGTFNNTTVIRLGAVIANPGTLTFSSQQLTNLDPASMLFLEDRQLGTFTDIRRSTYTFAVVQAGQINNRFYLHVTYPPTVNSVAAGCLNNDGSITVTEDSAVIWTACKVFDSTSTLVYIDTNITGNFSFQGVSGGNYRLEFDYSVYAPAQFVLVEEHQLLSGMNVSANHDFVAQDILFFTASSNATQFHWDFGDGSTITGIANPTYSYQYPGVYIAKVNCSNVFGCTTQSDTTMYIDFGTSIDQIDGNAVKFITDSKSLRIELDNASASDYSYNIYNVEGQMLKTGPITSSQQLMDFGDRASGIYIVTVRSATSSLSKKIFITH